MISFGLRDLFNGEGTGVAVDNRGAVSVSTLHPVAPKQGTKNRHRFFSALTGSTGANSGTTSMNVDGSTTPQEFYIAAHKDYDIHITQIIIYIEDTSVLNKEFGAIDLITAGTGWDLKIREAGEITFLIEKARSAGEVIVQTNTDVFGTSPKSLNEIVDVDGVFAANRFTFDLTKIMPDGIRIGRGTKDKITSVVNDNLIGLTDFTVRILGHRHYP